MPVLGEALTNLLIHHCSNIVKAFCTVSNVTAGNSDLIQGVINAGIIPQLLDVLKSVSISYLCRNYYKPSPVYSFAIHVEMYFYYSYFTIISGILMITIHS